MARRKWGFSAMTLGHVIIGRDPWCLEFCRDHEQAHVRQVERWGALFIPAYLLASVVGVVAGWGLLSGQLFRARCTTGLRRGDVGDRICRDGPPVEVLSADSTSAPVSSSAPIVETERKERAVTQDRRSGDSGPEPNVYAAPSVDFSDPLAGSEIPSIRRAFYLRERASKGVAWVNLVLAIVWLPAAGGSLFFLTLSRLRNAGIDI